MIYLMKSQLCLFENAHYTLPCASNPFESWRIDGDWLDGLAVFSPQIETFNSSMLLRVCVCIVILGANIITILLYYTMTVLLSLSSFVALLQPPHSINHTHFHYRYNLPQLSFHFLRCCAALEQPRSTHPQATSFGISLFFAVYNRCLNLYKSLFPPPLHARIGPIFAHYIPP